MEDTSGHFFLYRTVCAPGTYCVHSVAALNNYIFGVIRHSYPGTSDWNGENDVAPHHC